MKIYRRIVTDWDGNLIEEESEEYSGPITECKGGSQSTKETGTTEPWGPQIPYLTYGLGEAKRLYENAPAQSTIPQEASSALSNTLSGQYLSPTAWMTGGTDGGTTSSNAYIDQLASSIGNTVVPNVMSQYGLSGRTGTSPGAQGAVAEGISTALAPYMFGSAENQMNREFTGYQSERDRQLQALGLSPSLEQMVANAPWQQLSNYAGLVAGNYGGTQSGVSAGQVSTK